MEEEVQVTEEDKMYAANTITLVSWTLGVVLGWLFTLVCFYQMPGAFPHVLMVMSLMTGVSLLFLILVLMDMAYKVLFRRLALYFARQRVAEGTESK